VVAVPCYSHSLTNGRIRKTKRYTARMIDWLAVYDASTERCFYVPAAELGEGRWSISLRLRETKNGQSDGIRYARAYADPDDPPQRSLEVEPAGLEPAPSRMQTGRSPN
jgi:PD-(D/E)XK endonuclease